VELSVPRKEPSGAAHRERGGFGRHSHRWRRQRRGRRRNRRCRRLPVWCRRWYWVAGSFFREGEGTDGGGDGGHYTKENFRANLARRTSGAPPDAQAHRVFPQKFEWEFRRLGIDIHDPRFGVGWNRAEHQAYSAAYNLYWQEFLSRGNVSAGEALNFARQLANRYGYTVGF